MFIRHGQITNGTCLAAYPFPNPKDGSVYYDWTDRSSRTGNGSWRACPPGQTATKEEDVCRFVHEHRACVLDPETITFENARRREGNPTLPVLRFYAVVQHEGEVVIHKRHNPHMVISIGQSFAVTRNFLEPQYAVHLWDNAEGKRRCECNDGYDGAARTSWPLDLRDMSDLHSMAGKAGNPPS